MTCCFDLFLMWIFLWCVCQFLRTLLQFCCHILPFSIICANIVDIWSYRFWRQLSDIDSKKLYANSIKSAAGTCGCNWNENEILCLSQTSFPIFILWKRGRVQTPLSKRKWKFITLINSHWLMHGNKSYGNDILK